MSIHMFLYASCWLQMGVEHGKFRCQVSVYITGPTIAEWNFSCEW